MADSGMINQMNKSFVTDYNKTMNGTDIDGGGGSVYAYILWRVLEGIIGFLGVAGNGLVLFVFFKNKSLRNLINSLIINQSLIDFTTSFVFLLICFLPEMPLDPTSTAHLIFCRMWVSEYVLWALFISSSVNLVFITLDRYYAIIYPARYRSSASKINSRMRLIAILTWSSGFIFDCYWPAIHIVNSPLGNVCMPNWQSKVLKGVIGVFIFIVTYAAPLGVMAFSYICILSKLRKSSTRSAAPSSNQKSSPVKSQPSSDVIFKAVRRPKRAVSERSAQATRNIIKTLVSVSLTYAICWAPIAFNYLVYNLGGPLNFTSTWYAITKIFVDVNMCANPVIYTMQYQQFQRGFERTFGVKIFKSLPDSSDQTTKADASSANAGSGVKLDTGESSA